MLWDDAFPPLNPLLHSQGLLPRVSSLSLSCHNMYKIVNVEQNVKHAKFRYIYES